MCVGGGWRKVEGLRLAERERERESEISNTSLNFVDLVCVFVSEDGKGTLGC